VTTRFDEAIAAIDAANAGDPNTITIDGAARPKEQAHAELATAWLRRLDPDADEAQLLAVRAHHLRRWSIARRDFPDGRAGYLRWRTALKRQHAAEVGEILGTAGYDDATIARVQQIVQKVGLGSDPAVQAHEDALCLVFLETQLDELLDKLADDDKAVDVLAKTAKKMSAPGIALAAELPLSDRGKRLLERALA
jgi:predicted Zn-dependent protease